jgi:hypothetical protein
MKNFLLKLGFVTLFGMILSGCEKDLYEDALQQDLITYEKFSFSKDGKFNPVLSNSIMEIKGRTRAKQENGSSNRMVYDSIYNFYFDYENGIHIQDGSYDSYTFPVYKQNSNEKIQNLVFSKNDTGNFDSYFVKYDITKQELNTLSQAEISMKAATIDKMMYGIDTTNIAYRKCYEIVQNPRHFRPIANTTGEDFIYIQGSPWSTHEVPCDDGGSGGGGGSSSG